ncbi:monocarboxylate transporter 12-like [Ostrea edulis]|uniref:monocarboxylate transporter 12-like n=1 Tax=Ostrea edulis TaxID=37623 RepID=UPI00209602C1|nr:monocarboxylate transporter 12-like [Ostrea edulis]XP_048777916.1 monocarboxylate transporter 12-like [Ostrea edulis]XP_056012159.1 monocarboxylate transporter 12-like [Ostrea edulis]XP_056012160.1 monocarboxylate transporter 12-like [Ostrea edulis]
MASGKKTRHTSGDSTDSSEVDPSDYIPTPPDGGWGWVIVLSSFMCNMIVDGLGYSFGVLLPKWVEVFDETRGTVSLVGSLLCGIYLCAGPIVSGLTNKFGCRIVTVAGSIFGTLAFLAASFSQNITVLLLTYGFLGGLGFGLVYLPAIVIVGYYFEKKRAIATGIALCGSGVGTFIFAPANAMMLDAFDWRSLVMIQAGIVLNACVFGMLMRPLEPTKKMRQSLRKQEIENARKKAVGNRKRNAHSDSSMKGASDFTDLKEIKKIKEKQEDETKTASSENTSGFLKGVKAHEIHPTIQNGYAKTQGEPFLSVPRLRGDSFHHVTKSDYSRPMYRQDIFYSGSITNMPEYKSSQSDMKQYIASITNIPDIPSSSCWDRCTCLPMSVVDTLRDMLDISLLTDIPFLMICAGNLLAMTGFYVPFTYVVDHALQLGISKPDAAFLLSIIGITNTVGRIASGLLVDIFKLDALVINNVALVLSAVLLFVEPFCKTYELLIGFSVLYGFCVAAYISLTSIIICNLLGLRKLTNAFGLVTLARGVAGVLGPPAAGAVYTATGSYNYSFWLGGLMFALGAGCHLVLHLPCVKKKAKGNDSDEIVIAEEEDKSMIKDCGENV